MPTYINPMNDLAPALGNIADTVATVIDPNYKFKQAARSAIASNPDLIRQLSAVEDNAPGTLEAMGFGKQLTSIIRRAPIPEKDMIEKLTRPAVKAAASNPKLAESRATQQVANQTPQAITVADFQAAMGQAGTKALQDPNIANIAGTTQATGARPAQLGTEAINFKSLEAASKFLDQNPQSIPQVAEGIFKGNIPMSVASGLFSGAYGEALTGFLNVRMAQESLDARVAVANAGNSGELSDATRRMMWSRTLPIATKIGVDPNTLIKYFNDPSTRARADRLAADPSLIKTDEDRSLAAASNGIARMNVAERHKMYRDSAFEIITLVDKQKKNEDDGNDPSLRSAIRSQIQEQLDLRHETLGAPELTVKYGKPPTNRTFLGHTFGDDQFYYIDKSGKIVDDTVAQSFDPVLDPELKRKVDIVQQNLLKAPENTRAQALENLRKSDPDVYNAFKTQFDTSGFEE
jgi:hypothetical protein